MMRSMYSGISGLRVHQTKMDVIGNNIANVNTAGFKAGRVTFSEVFNQTLQGASGANEATGRGGTNPMQVGLGVNIASIDTLMTEGAAQRTDNPLDLKVEGEGFFVVDDGSGYKFTRAGAFRIDSSGNIVSPEGQKLMGWGVNNNTGEIEKGVVESLSILSPANLYSEPEKTTNVYLEGNIDRNDTQLDPLNGGVPFTISFYDSLGYRYTAELKLTSTAGDTDFAITVGAVKDSKGETKAVGTDSVTVSFNPATGKVNLTGDTQLNITGLNGATDFSEMAEPLTVDLSQLTLFSGKTSIQSVRGDTSGFGAGREAGTMSGFSIGPDGKIQGRYTNGENKLLGQVVIAQFRNPAGLQKVGNNLFQVTTNSGDFDGIGMDPTATGGALNAGVLEMSNVDLSREFTEMITTQRGFQANSRIITSSDEMLQELVNLKR
ncbi:flagellar hook protein FlgE [Natranaerovirga pectinivora]|uniref:Flagellar hook protein FlgE n=1 Tax=Natranaerovirga pectinivora TaxID=682400 RepID=A0A4R3MSK4_9FIRM|nr:flagellar hook protein FlgE [Natranaerovirga pectinivora]TCT16428.1 flagellar hook protein FlgE [Natranaerovirga pectinivora]